MNIFLNILFGLIAGVLGGLGMGGGTLLIPLLTIFLGFDQKLSQGINLVSFVVMAIFALIIHFKNGYVKTRGLIYLIIGGVIFSIFGSFLAGYLPNKVLRMAFGVFLCLLSIAQVIKVIKK